MPFAMREVPRGFAVMTIGFGPPFRVGLADQGLERGGAEIFRPPEDTHMARANTVAATWKAMFGALVTTGPKRARDPRAGCARVLASTCGSPA